MQCPVCDVTLKMADRQGIEIDYCPQCRGVWLDRGELDKIIERSLVNSGRDYDDDDDYHDEPRPIKTMLPPEKRKRGKVYDDDPSMRHDHRPSKRRYDDDDDDYDGYDDRNYGKRRKKRDSFLEDLFDLFD